jgi:hypothetical protein
MKATTLLALAFALPVAAACSLSAGKSADPTAPPPGAAASGDGGAESGPSPQDQGTGSAEALYPTLNALHDQAMSRTCALNNGVCHNSKQYPDLHTPTALIAAVNQACNAQVDTHADFRDPCEPHGDHLVTTGLDAEIATANQAPADAPTTPAGQITSVTLNFAAPLAAAPKVDPTAILDIHRGTTVIHLTGAKVSAATTTSVTIDLTKASAEVKAFLDDRVYPWTDLMVRVADPNQNGVLGAAMGMSLIVPGDPDKSYVMARIVSDTYGEYMPAVCRAWSEAATRALGCWIKGLKVDASGTVQNGFDPIDYASCDYDPTGKGRCVQDGASGFAAVQSIFSKSCGGSSCHVDQASPQGGLDLSVGKAAGALVGVASSEASMPRVTPGNPDQSYLWCKLEPTCAARTGDRMPRGGPWLSDADLATIKAWIEGGAPLE